MNSCSANHSASLPQQMLEALERLRAHTTSTALRSFSIYDLVDQHTLCTSHPVAAMLGYSADAIHEMGAIGLADLIHPDDLNRVSEHYQQFTTLRYGEVITIDYRMKRADGTWCWLRSQETPLVRAIDGLPLQILGMLQYITPPSIRRFRKPVVLDKVFRQRRLIQRTRISRNRRRQRVLSRLNQPKSAF